MASWDQVVAGVVAAAVPVLVKFGNDWVESFVEGQKAKAGDGGASMPSVPSDEPESDRLN